MIQDIVSALSEPNAYIRHPEVACIDTHALAHAVKLFRAVVFDGYFNSDPVETNLRQLHELLMHLVGHTQTFFSERHPAEHTLDSEAIATQLVEMLPELRRRLSTDVKAIFDGDPAAHSYDEVILCYPAVVALVHYRLAHELQLRGVPLLPRMITEMAHSLTGIDIHPAATIGDYFSIDHGTGVVIGETTLIGDHVRLYQGVTLGARSFKYDADGKILQEPRHPIIEDYVVIYACSSILGRVHIGHHAVIGCNQWITADVPPYWHACKASRRATERA